MKEKIIVSVSIVCIAIALVGITIYGTSVAEKNECIKLVEYSKTLKDFYITTWQEEMCTRYAIEINAPII
jgi:hypothetical protein